MSERDSDDIDGIVSFHDLTEIGFQITEMADRLKPVALSCPGSVATWSFELDGTEFTVTLSLKEPKDGARTEGS